MHGNTQTKITMLLKPIQVTATKIFNVFPSFSTRYHSCNS
ncbi:hypothetical protein MGSAQ_000229 [marine sediment metagenome]|uniref:Uncharacterized protein n=1 Tax=marine sediment metagenome TaxID=412755 RepID=A0A1B6NXY3_9ZZZZ